MSAQEKEIRVVGLSEDSEVALMTPDETCVLSVTLHKTEVLVDGEQGLYRAYYRVQIDGPADQWDTMSAFHGPRTAQVSFFSREVTYRKDGE